MDIAKLVEISGNVLEKDVLISTNMFSVGRGINNSCVIKDLSVSRTHFIFEQVNDEWSITDKSSNGTWLNKVRLEPSKKCKIVAGDIISLSETIILQFQKVACVYFSEDDFMDADAMFAQVDAIEAEIDKERKELRNKICSSKRVNEVIDLTNSSYVENSSRKLIPVSEEGCVNIVKTNVASTAMNLNSHELEKNISHEGVQIVNTVEIRNAEPNVDVVDEVDKTKNVDAEKSAKTELRDVNIEYAEDELQCTICTEMFVKAVTLSCSHTFCKYCISEWRKTQSVCPICRTRITLQFPTLVVDNFIEKILETASEEKKKQRLEIIEERRQLEENGQKKTAVQKKARTNQNTSTSAHSESSGSVDASTSAIEISSDEETDSYDDGINDWECEYENDSWYDSEDYDGLPGIFYGGYGACFTCGSRKHWANGCPNKRR